MTVPALEGLSYEPRAYGIELGIYPSTQARYQVRLQCAVGSTASSNWRDLYTFSPSQAGEIYWSHRLPNDGVTRFYRAFHTLPGYSDGAVTSVVAGVPTHLGTVRPFASGHQVDLATGLTGQRCRVIHSALQNVPTGVPTVLSWNLVNYDTANIHNLTNTDRLTIPPGGDFGIWLFSVQITWSTNATGFRQVDLLKTTLPSTVTTVATVASGASPSGGTVQHLVYLENAPTVGNFFQVRCQQNSGVGVSVSGFSSYFTATHVSA